MNGIEKITARIGADAQQEIDALLAQTNVQVQEIAAEYEAKAARAAKEILDKGEQDAAVREERLVSAARMDARKAMLAQQQALMDQAFRKALDDLLNLPDKDYVALVASLIVEASQTGREEVVFSQKDRPRYGKAAVTRANELLGDRGHLTLSAQTRPIQGGFLLSDGDVEVNCTFETLVLMQRRTVERQVAQVLFEG